MQSKRAQAIRRRFEFRTRILDLGCSKANANCERQHENCWLVVVAVAVAVAFSVALAVVVIIIHSFLSISCQVISSLAGGQRKPRVPLKRTTDTHGHFYGRPSIGSKGSLTLANVNRFPAERRNCIATTPS